MAAPSSETGQGRTIDGKRPDFRVKKPKVSDSGRRRQPGRLPLFRRPDTSFTNPYSWMSEIEAMVHLDLEARRVPFSWRYFNGDSITLKALVPDFNPEFTLVDYKTVILIIGNYWGTLPTILDTNALAQAALEADGWTVISLFEDEIRKDVHQLIDRKVPALVAPRIQGPPAVNPYGVPDFMSKRRLQLSGQGLRKAQFKQEDIQSASPTIRRVRKRLTVDGTRRRFKNSR